MINDSDSYNFTGGNEYQIFIEQLNGLYAVKFNRQIEALIVTFIWKVAYNLSNWYTVTQFNRINW